MTPFIKIAFLTAISLSLPACVAQQTKKNDSHQSSNTETSFIDDTMTRTGLVNAKELVSNYPKFKKHYDDFEPEGKDVKNFSLLKDMDIVVFFGLWCHDSQREVPHLIKLIEQSGNQFNSVKLVALNTKKELPDEYADQFEVKYTPTIFVVKDGQILAKIIEKPKTTLAQDLLSQILH